MQLVPRRILVALAVVCLPVAAVAQAPATISGTVTREDGSPLPGATVAIPSLGLGATTRPDGRYSVLVPANRARAPKAAAIPALFAPPPPTANPPTQLQP